MNIPKTSINVLGHVHFGNAVQSVPFLLILKRARLANPPLNKSRVEGSGTEAYVYE
jgi:hypothetical protein